MVCVEDEKNSQYDHNCSETLLREERRVLSGLTIISGAQIQFGGHSTSLAHLQCKLVSDEDVRTHYRNQNLGLVQTIIPSLQ